MDKHKDLFANPLFLLGFVFIIIGIVGNFAFIIMGVAFIIACWADIAESLRKGKKR